MIAKKKKDEEMRLLKQQSEADRKANAQRVVTASVAQKLGEGK